MLQDSSQIYDIEVGTVKGLIDIDDDLFHNLKGFDAGKIR